MVDRESVDGKRSNQRGGDLLIIEGDLEARVLNDRLELLELGSKKRRNKGVAVWDGFNIFF